MKIFFFQSFYSTIYNIQYTIYNGVKMPVFNKNKPNKNNPEIDFLFILKNIFKNFLNFLLVIGILIFLWFVAKIFYIFITFLLMKLFSVLNQPMLGLNSFNAGLASDSLIKLDPSKDIQNPYYLEQQRDIQKRYNDVKEKLDAQKRSDDIQLRLRQKEDHDMRMSFEKLDLDRNQAYEKFYKIQDQLDRELLEPNQHILRVIMKNQRMVRPENYLSDERKTAYNFAENISEREKIALDQLESDLLQVQKTFERLDKKMIRLEERDTYIHEQALEEKQTLEEKMTNRNSK